VFAGRDSPNTQYVYYGYSSSYRPDKVRTRIANEKSIVASVYNRIANDVASIKIVHARLDDQERFSEVIESGLNSCFNLEANIDQTGRDFIFDLAQTIIEEGHAVIVPIETEDKLSDDVSGNAFDILSMRVGTVTQWYPKYVRVRVYNEETGQHTEIVLPKRQVSIIYNPFYSIMNEPNSTLQRLKTKLALMDDVDKKTNSGKLDLIIQLPYVVKTKIREEQAEKRRKSVINQLSESEYGVAYTDGTERIVQLNRPVESNLLDKVEYLRKEFFTQLGITEEIMNGTADEKTMLNYYNRVIEPIVSSIVDEVKRKFLSKTARTQGHSVMFFRDPFKLVPVEQLAELADKFTRNEIMSSNEFRQIVGREPSKDPQADQLRNSNINAGNEQHFATASAGESDTMEVKANAN
jgi:hypothetical protein